MRVLMFGWEFPPHISGGLGTACYGLTKGLVQHDVDILFVVPKAFGDEDQSIGQILSAEDVTIKQTSLQFEDIWKEITYMEVGSILIPYVSPEDFEEYISKEEKTSEGVDYTSFTGKFKFSGKYGGNLYQEVSNYALVAASIAANNDFDVIHAHDWLTYAAGVAAKRISGKPLVAHIHATEFDRSGEQVNQIVYDLERMGMQEADRVIAVSNLTRKVVIERYGVDPDKVFTVYNAVQPLNKAKEKFEKNVDEKIVTFLGRITQQKGPEYFIEAAYKVLQRMDNVRFVMAGSGDMLRRMVRHAASLGIMTKFHFTGFLRGKEVDQMFGISDVYVMPSISEPFGISPLEAMRSNVPVIISKQSGVAEILQHAIKVDFWDIDAMADSIYGLIKYDGLSKMFRHHGKTEVDNLKWENAAHHVKEVYQTVIS